MGNEKLVYIPDFYSRQDADELFEFIRSQPHTRPDNMLSRSLSEYSSPSC